MNACPDMQVVLHITLQSPDMRERVGALKVLLAFCTANQEGQHALVSSLPMLQAKGNQPAGLLTILLPYIQAACKFTHCSLSYA